MFEFLEARRFLNATLDGSGNLVVNGSANADTITLAVGGANLDVAISPEGFSQSFPIASITSVLVSCGDDNDAATVDEAFTVRVTMRGGNGNDTLIGGGGNDRIIGEAEDDTLDGRAGGDQLEGDTGNDTLTYASRTNAVSAYLDTDNNDGEAGEGDNIDDTIDTIIGGAGDDRISASSSGGPRAFYGMNGNDTLAGDTAADRLNGGQGNDDLRGFGGDDVLIGGPGRDKFNGGAGNDTATYYNSTRALNISLDDGTNDGEALERDNVKSDVENVDGGQNNDTLVGSAADNQLDGRDGNDSLTGGTGADTLLGGAGNDALFAADGASDTLDGGAGTSDTADVDQLLDSVTNVP